MIDTLGPYPAYKSSGLPWVPEVPDHWRLLPNRGLVRRRKNLVGEHHADFQLPSLTKQGVIVRDISEGKGKFSSDMGTSQEVHPGNLVFCLFDVPETPRTVGLSRHEGMITGAYTVFESIGDCGPEYFEKFYIAMDDRKLLSPLYSGLRNTIPPSRFLATRTPVPPPDEQAAIVRFLDHADRRIRRYIRVKRQLITLLNEQKQAIIHRAVTRGLDPNVRLKPSGVEWLGDVPEHWSLRRFKFATTITSGQVDPRRVEYRDQILIAPNHIESGTGRITCEETADAQGADSGKYQVRRGQVIYSKIRPNLRKAAIAPKDCLCSADMYPITPRPNQLTGDYLLLLMLSAPFTKYTVDCSMRVAMPKINREALGECWLWFPSIEEQRSIIARVNEQTGAYFDATQKIQHEVGLMLEYRTRLYADVVTGKLDVREAAARLPEGVKEGDAVTEDLLDDEEVADDTELDAEPEEVEV